MSQPLCEKCQKEPSTIRISELTKDGQRIEQHLCEPCAAKETFQRPGPGGQPIQIGLLPRALARKARRPPRQPVLCDRCKQRPAAPGAYIRIEADGTVTEQHVCKTCDENERAKEISTHELAREVRSAILQSADVKRRFAESAATDIAMAAKITAICLRGGGKVLLCGNGGSAAEAQHIAGELVGRFKLERRAFAAVALTANAAILTAIANDYSFDDVFARSVQGLGVAGDILFAYSTSGNSPNVLKAIVSAKALGIHTIGFTGSTGGKMAALCDLCIKVPSDDTPTVQECHTAAGHTICRLVERLLSTSSTPSTPV